jgi:hypothetical protein
MISAVDPGVASRRAHLAPKRVYIGHAIVLIVDILNTFIKP